MLLRFEHHDFNEFDFVKGSNLESTSRRYTHRGIMVVTLPVVTAKIFFGHPPLDADHLGPRKLCGCEEAGCLSGRWNFHWNANRRWPLEVGVYLVDSTRHWNPVLSFKPIKFMHNDRKIIADSLSSLFDHQVGTFEAKYCLRRIELSR